MELTEVIVHWTEHVGPKVITGTTKVKVKDTSEAYILSFLDGDGWFEDHPLATITKIERP